MFIAASFIIAKTENNLYVYQLVDGQKKNVVYSYNGKLLSNQKEQMTDIRYNINEPQPHHTKWMKAGEYDYILYNLTHVRCLEKQVYRNRN